MVWWNLYIIIFMAALASTLVLTPVCRKFAVWLNFFDQPEEQHHKRHTTPTPLLGGPAICLSWLFTIVLGIAVPHFLNYGRLNTTVISNLPGILTVSKRLGFICLGAILATLLGLYDDRYNMSAKTKLAGQMAIAAIAVTWGDVKISLFISSPVISWCISVFWIILVMNAINFFDNMDGLAAGTATIAFSFFTIAAIIHQQYFVAALGAATSGASLGFWFYNHHPAVIFMGDSGSHFLGYNLAVLGALATFYAGNEVSRFSILIPLFILAIPLFDVAAVVLIRWRAGKPFYIGDLNHISHRFVKMGMSKRRAVFMVHLLALVIGLSVLPLLWGDERTTIVCILQACTILILITLLQYSRTEHLDDKN